MRFCFSLIFICLYSYSIGQILSVTIIDSVSGLPVAYATTLVKNKNTVLNNSADEHGKIALGSLSDNDTVNISCIGYYPRIELYKNIIKSDLLLTPRFEELQEITIAYNKKEKTIPFYPDRSSSYFVGHMKGLELATGIDFLPGDRIKKNKKDQTKGEAP